MCNNTQIPNSCKLHDIQGPFYFHLFLQEADVFILFISNFRFGTTYRYSKLRKVGSSPPQKELKKGRRARFSALGPSPEEPKLQRLCGYIVSHK